MTETEALNKATEASREAIDFDVGESVVRLRDVNMLIRSIFKARGTCGECRHYDKRPNVPDYNVCLLQAEYRMADWHCADFEGTGGEE